MTAYVLTNAQGAAVSIGTIQPSPVPTGLTVNNISDADWDAIRTGLKKWLNGSVVDTDKAATEANRASIDQALADALATLQGIIDGPSVGAGTLTTAQLSTIARQLEAAVKDLARIDRKHVRYTTGRLDAAT